jgi:6-phosphofructokinase
MRLAVLTGGGDVPGLNPCIKAIVNRATDEGHEVLGIRRGWAGLLDYNLEAAVSNQDTTQWVLPLHPETVRTIDRYGGTHLHTSRTNPSRVSSANLPSFLKEEYRGEGPFDCTPHILRVIEHLGIDALLPIGGDDTLSYALRLHREGVPIVAIPKTMDNDVYGTDYCIGFSTAVTRSVEYLHALRTPTGSHERIGVIELFGRNSGETALVSAYLADVDRTVIPEVPVDVERLATLVMADKRRNPSNYAMIAVSEGAVIAGGGVVEHGEADPYGNLAVELVLRGESGQMVALRNGVYTEVPLEIISEGVKRVDVAELYDADHYRPKVQHLMGKPMFLY